MSEEEIKAITDKAIESRNGIVRVTPHDFWRFAQALTAKIERDDAGEFITLQVMHDKVRLEPTA